MNIIKWFLDKREKDILKSAEEGFDEADFIAAQIVSKSIKKKECLHYWEWGYLGDSMIYCTKCNRDADEIYDEKDFSYRTHTCKDGSLKLKG